MTARTKSCMRVGAAVLCLVLFGFCANVLMRARRDGERSTMPSMMPGFAAGVSSADASRQPESRQPESQHTGIALRLVDELANAKVDIPSMGDRHVRAMLTSHWRRHHAPFVGPGGELGRLVQSVGLARTGVAATKPIAGAEAAASAKSMSAKRTIASAHSPAVGRSNGTSGRARPTAAGSSSKQPSPRVNVSAGGKERSEREIRTFGLGEGSYDQRECIVAPSPSSLKFSRRIPRDAKLRVAPAILGDQSATFRVNFRHRASGVQSLIGTLTLNGPSRHFDDWVLDLQQAGVSDSDGELELSTESKTREPVVALWGSPVIVAPKSSHLPYNVLFIIVDAMRSDAIAASHNPEEDALRRSAKRPPLEAWFEAMPEVAPELDRLAARGAIFEHAWSAAMWTRPATLSILTGLRASHTGLDVLALELIGDQRRNFYASKPPLLPLAMRRAGAATAAFVNNMYLSGSVGVGVDLAFEAVVDHRLQALDTRSITAEALKFLTERGNERFFLLLNYASPHAPYYPPPKDLRAVRAARNRPENLTVQNYLGEVHKDDAAIGDVLRKLDALHLREDTLVVVTADHGETMSAAHDVVAIDVAQGAPSGRFTHLSTMWEEAARVGLVIALPGRVPEGLRLAPRVQTIDLMPTILELEGLGIPKEVEGRSLVPLFGGKSIESRPVVIEGRGARSIIEGKFHCIFREPVARRLRHMGDEFEREVELYDLEADPGERKDIAAQHPDVVAALRSRLDGVLATEQRSSALPMAKQRLHLRFATAGRVAQLQFDLKLKGASTTLNPVGIDARTIRSGPDHIRVATATSAERAIGFDLEYAGNDLPTWEVTLDGKPWPKDRIFVGPLGQSTSDLARGVADGVDLTMLDSPSIPHIVATSELGMFVTREPSAGTPEIEASAAAQFEAEQAMQAWGYARKPTAKRAH